MDFIRAGELHRLHLPISARTRLLNRVGEAIFRNNFHSAEQDAAP